MAESLGVGLGTISSVLTRAQGVRTDSALENRLYGPPEVGHRCSKTASALGLTIPPIDTAEADRPLE